MDQEQFFWVDRHPHIDDEEEPLPDEHDDTPRSSEDEEDEEDFEYDNESNDEYALHLASHRPPAHAHEDGGGYPWRGGPVLLELEAYFSDHRNATTASCELRRGKGVLHVTFCTAAPPLVSHYCLHYSGGLKLSHFAIEPEIVASEGGLVLLRVPIGDSDLSSDPEVNEYFVYHAGDIPTLTQLPHPGPDDSLRYRDTCILRYCQHHRGHHGASDYHDCSHCGYAIASLSPGPEHQAYELILFSSETMAWSCETILTDEETAASHRCTSNTITIGGKRGTVGWVDLSRGTLFCNVLAARGHRALRYVPLPPIRTGTPMVSRDIAVVNGFIKCVVLQVWDVPGSFTRDGGFTADGWSAQLWSMKISDSLSEPWHLDNELDSTELCDSLPELKVDAGTVQPTLQRLHTGQPTLSLQDDGIVYFLTKIDRRDADRNGWVLDVDTANRTIRGVAEFGCERTLGFGRVYIASRISEYLPATPGG